MKLVKKFWLLLPFAIVLPVAGLILWKTQPRTPNLPEPPLKALAQDHGIQLGNFAISSRLNEKPYSELLSGQFDLALADNTPNWYFTDGGLRPSETTYNFTQMDQVVQYAQDHNMPVQAHHFLWGEQKWLPNWLKNGNYSKDQLLQIIHDHIQTVGNHYSGQVQEWTVVNEPFTRAEGVFGLNDWWQDRLGQQDYIDNAFKWARQADPHATLILNDFNNEAINQTSNDMYDYVRAAKARGVPIDAVGFQMHLDGTHPPVKDEVIANMKRFGDLGVKVYVTEFDVNMHDLQVSNSDKDKIEGNIYYDMMRACIESKVCPSFSILGITDRETWYSYIGLNDSRPLPFDKNYQPKPAYYALRAALEQP